MVEAFKSLRLDVVFFFVVIAIEVPLDFLKVNLIASSSIRGSKLSGTSKFELNRIVIIPY